MEDGADPGRRHEVADGQACPVGGPPVAALPVVIPPLCALAPWRENISGMVTQRREDAKAEAGGANIEHRTLNIDDGLVCPRGLLQLSVPVRLHSQPQGLAIGDQVAPAALRDGA